MATQIQTVSVPDGPGIAANLERQWQEARASAVGLYAFSETLVGILGKEGAIRAVGKGNALEGRNMLRAFKQDLRVAARLDDGSAVLVAFEDPIMAPGLAMIGVYPAKGARQAAGLGVLPLWVFVALGAGIVLASTHFYFRHWGMEIESVKADSERMALKVADQIVATAARVALTDPAAAAEILRAGKAAIEAAKVAQQNPEPWLEQLMGKATGAGVTAFLNQPWVWVGLGLYLYSRAGRAR